MFAQMLLNAVAGTVSVMLASLLNKFRELNGDEKADKLKSTIKDAFTLLREVTDKTKTKIDDKAVTMILDAVDQAS